MVAGMGDYNIRRTDDWTGVQKINNRHFNAEIYQDYDGAAWFVYYKGFVVGFCSCRVLEGGTLYLTRAAIQPEHRGKGLHKRMLRVREAYGRRVGCGEAITYVAKDNMPSIMGLVKSNYKLYDPEYAYVGRSEYYYFIKSF